MWLINIRRLYFRASILPVEKRSFPENTVSLSRGFSIINVYSPYNKGPKYMKQR